ncbi:MAG: DUF4252 domain-containing protein [Saprospiraceae bacterium]|jgi:hypothetical protein|nr:DUF4252 domain-containing protein [Saprospiraceae bacterium]
MKKVMLLLPFLFFAAILSAQNDAINRFFSQYMDDERFTVVFVSPKMFNIVSKISTDDKDWENFREVIGGLKGLRVLTADSIADGMKLYKEALDKVPATEYEELVTVRDGKENVRIWVKDSGNIINELLLLVGSPDQFVLLSLAGKIDLDKISSLSKGLDIEGIKHLEKAKTKE